MAFGLLWALTPTHELDLQATPDLATLDDCLGRSTVESELRPQQPKAHVAKQLAAAQNEQTEASDSISEQVCHHFDAKRHALLYASCK